MSDLTEDKFNDFITRLKSHNEGDGVNWHLTSNPVFIVQSLERVCGIDAEYDPDYFWVNSDNEGEWGNEDLKEELLGDEDVESGYDEFDIERDDEITRDGKLIYKKIGYVESWEYVNANFTKEGAEAFIKRKSHDYRKLRVYVSSQYFCSEFNMVISGMLDGSIVMANKADDKQS